MEPRQSEKSVESHGERQASPTHQPERKRRFQIVKLEERIAPGGGQGTGHTRHQNGCGTGNSHQCGS
jgi:hypothetical protein